MGDPEEHGTADRGVQLYDTEAVRDVLSGLSLEGSTSGDSIQSRDEKTAAITENLAVSERMFCSFCDTPFNDRRQQKSHYKSDWHRFNLKQRLKCQPTLSEELFEQTMEDVSSISGSGTDTNSSSSESESDSSCSKKEKVKLSRREVDREDGSDPEVDGTMEGMGRLNPWVFFRNKQDELVSIHRVVLQNKKAPVQTAQELVKLATALPGHLKWAVLMAGGGHFAAALFHGAQVMAHKTFHRYVVRAKRGSAQSTRDGQGNAPKSGGASLRRYNEAALMQEIQELLRNWADRLRECDYIFLRAPSFNRSIFFGGRDAPLRKNDLRIRTIPFQTRRPTFHEVQRIHRLLATVRCHGCTTSLPRPVRLSPKKVTRDNIPQQSETAVTVDQKDCAEAVITSESSFGTIVMETPPGDQESSSDTEIQFSMETFDTLHLKQYDCCSRKPRRQRGKGGNNSRKMGEKQEEDPAMDESSRQLRNQLYTACKSCDLHSLHQLLEELTHQSGSTELIDLVEQQNINCSPADDAEEQQKMECSEKVRCSVVQNSEGARSGNLENTQKTEGDFSTITTDILNKPFGDGQRTLLHVTAEAGSSEMVSLLLRVGADPTLKDKLGRTPYTVASNKPTRNEFRKFRTEFPDRYNYGEAQIPEAISQEQEEKRKDRESARKRAQRKAKKERLKDQKAEEAKKEEVTRETDRFLALSDREKRALMAERRLLGQMSTLGDTSVILSRCWQCGVDISGKVPFEYLDFRFCSPRCLKQHRTINKTR